MSKAAISFEGETIMEMWLAGIATIGITIYLLFALLKPESF